MADVEPKLSFKELLAIQLAPHDAENIARVERFCHAIIENQLSMSSRLKQGVLKTGTKIFEKGVSIAKFGLNLFSSKKAGPSETPVEGAAAADDGRAGALEERDEQRVELKWVMVYQVLHKMLEAVGFHEVASSEHTFSLDRLVLKEVLEGKDPQIIRHLLVYAQENPAKPHIAQEKLFQCLMESVKTFWLDDSDKTSLEKNFFIYHMFAKCVLDLL